MKKKVWIPLLAVILLIAAVLLWPETPKQESEPSSVPTEEELKTVLFLPDTMVTYSEGRLRGDFALNYKEGWQTADSFYVMYNPSKDNTEDDIPFVTYKDKMMITEVPDVSREEITYDEKGNVITQITTYEKNGSFEKIEKHFTYDDYGRLVVVMNSTWLRGSAEARTEFEGYEYTDTETGSEASFENFGRKYTRVYDKDYRLVCVYMYLMDRESTRTEYTYDEYGNLLTAVTYLSGDKIDYEVRYTYKAVEVGEETIARWVQFNSNQ